MHAKRPVFGREAARTVTPERAVRLLPSGQTWQKVPDTFISSQHIRVVCRTKNRQNIRREQ
jgi:hypothetical protein